MSENNHQGGVSDEIDPEGSSSEGSNGDEAGKLGPDGLPVGYGLIEAIEELAHAEGLPVTEILQRVPIGPVYFNMLKGNKRPIPQVSSEKLRTIAALLGMSPMEVFLMSGKMVKEDLYAPPALKQIFEDTYKRLGEHSQWKYFRPQLDEWLDMSLESKYLITHMFNQIEALRLSVAVEDAGLGKRK